jgi:hypothetical protein
MTAQQPHREYIITEEQVQTVHHLFSIPDHAMDDADYMMQEEIVAAIRTRPHTPAPDTMTISVKEFEQYIKDKQEQAARAATLATRQNCNERLLNVKTRVYDYSKQMSPEAYQAIMNSFDNVFYRVKSLRAAAQEDTR